MADSTLANRPDAGHAIHALQAGTLELPTDTKTITLRMGLDDNDRLAQLTLKLNALLAHTYGCSGEEFRNLNDEIQDSYMWACSDMASDIKELVYSMQQVRQDEGHKEKRAA